MKNIFLLIFFSSFFGLFAEAQDYTATVREIDKPDSPALFTIDVTRSLNGDLKTTTALTKENGKIVLEEIGVVNSKTNELVTYDINQLQTGETGRLKFPGNKVEIEYTGAGRMTPVKKDFLKPALLTGPPNYEDVIKANFEKLKKDKTLVVNFLVWDRLDTYQFKVTYLGETELNGEKTHAFKMNIDNILVAAFISPIRVWFNSDLSQLRKFSGRVGVKNKVDGKYKDLDADVIYAYKPFSRKLEF